MRIPNLTVFTVADRRYEPFVLPYIASVLSHNSSAFVEIVVECDSQLPDETFQAQEIVAASLGARFRLRQADLGGQAPTLRFLMAPETTSDYAYIGDVDVLVLEEIAPAHLSHMAQTGLPYSNIRRPRKERLSGLHFTEWSAFYPRSPDEAALLDEVKANYRVKGIDEHYLFRLIKERGRGLPDPEDTFRPEHGLHLTLSRDPLTRRGNWGGLRDPVRVQQYLAFQSTLLWQELAPLLSRRYRMILAAVNTAVACTWPEKVADMKSAPGTKLSDCWD